MKNDMDKIEQYSIISDFLNQASKKHNVPVEKIATGILNNDLYVWKMSDGLQTEFEVLEIINITGDFKKFV